MLIKLDEYSSQITSYIQIVRSKTIIYKYKNFYRNLKSLFIFKIENSMLMFNQHVST